MYGTVKKRTNLYVLRSTGNAYDVIGHRRLSGPRAPQYFGQVYAHGNGFIRTLATQGKQNGKKLSIENGAFLKKCKCHNNTPLNNITQLTLLDLKPLFRVPLLIQRFCAYR